MTDPIITTHDLTVYYGKHRGIVEVNLEVRAGEIFGFLGPNGAGKTTTQRVLLDLIRPTKGSASIFGMDCQKDSVEIRRRIGYLPGELSLYENMTGADYLNLFSQLRGINGDPTYRKELCHRLDLDATRKMGEYSRGNKQKVGVVAAFMNKPELLVLDEPTTGLDPLVQQNVLRLVREAKAEGRTVFFSSHVLPEVQAVCDRVGIIREGKLIATERVQDMMKQQFRRVRVRLANSPAEGNITLPGVALTDSVDNEFTFEIRENLNKFLEMITQYQVIDIETLDLTLEEVFMAYYGSNEGGSHV